MSIFQWFVFFLFIQVVHFFGTWKLYEIAGRKRWEAFIPVYNAVVLTKIIGRPTWWTILLFIPIINLIMFPLIWIETLRSYGKKSSIDTFLVLISLGFYIYYINYTQKLKYNPERNLIPENKTADTISSFLFAIIVATLVHTYFIQPYTIPSSSLEKSLLIGDFLFVSKINYGARVPMTTIAAPMVHDSLPFTKKLSYLSKPQLPYFRFPGFEKIKNNDIVVFNWPRDTLDNMYHPSNIRIDKPRDKKTNYVKRCVGIPGDSLQIKDGIVFINGKELILPERAKPQYSYKVAYDGKTPIDFEFLLKDMKITDGAYFLDDKKRDTIAFRALTFEGAERLRHIPGITAVTRVTTKGTEDGIFPDYKDGKASVTNNWNCDNFGPIYVPQEGKTVQLDKISLPFYKIIISEYEGNKLKVEGNSIYINDKIATTYTFKQNYYWMMGDNRHNSLDARYFGYTPEDHIVGKPIFIWMSWDTNGKGLGKIRWERLFTTVSGEGQPQSYFKMFVLGLITFFVGEYFWKKRKEKNNKTLRS
jgi:signal peptidase I